MRKLVGLIRAVNVGGRNRMPMAALRDFLGTLGITGVETLLQSGNFVCDPTGDRPGELERTLEAAAASQWSFAPAFFMRDARQWDEVIAENPYPCGEASGSRMLVYLLRNPDRELIGATVKELAGTEQVTVLPDRMYVACPDGIGTSKLLNASRFNRALGIATARNWNTALALQRLTG